MELYKVLAHKGPIFAWVDMFRGDGCYVRVSRAAMVASLVESTGALNEADLPRELFINAEIRENGSLYLN